MIVTQLLSDYQRIGLINRAQLLDDSFNVARVNKLPYPTPLSLALYLVNEKDYIPWVSATNGLGYIDLMFVRTSGYGDLKVCRAVSNPIVVSNERLSFVQAISRLFVFCFFMLIHKMYVYYPTALHDQAANTALQLCDIQPRTQRRSPTDLHASLGRPMGL
jgi:hypothetical protein